MDICVVSTFLLLWIMLLWSISCSSPCFQFFWLYAQKWSCWIIWKFYVEFFEKPPYCFPQWLHHFTFPLLIFLHAVERVLNWKLPIQSQDWLAGVIKWVSYFTHTQLPQSGKDKPHLACQPHRTVIRIQQNEVHRLLYKLKCYLIQVIISRLY